MAVKPGYKQTEVGVIPEDWEVKCLGKFATIATGNTPPTADSANYGDEFLFVSPADLGETKYVTKTEKRLSQKGFAISRRFPKDSILFVCIGSTIGKCGIASVEMSSNQQINAIFPSPEFSADFLYYAVSAAAPKIRSLAGEQAVPLVNKTQFSETEVVLPPLPEQRVIATALGDVDALLGALERLIVKKRDLKKAAMQQLLTGQIRLTGFEGEWNLRRLGDIARVQRGASPRPIDNPVWFDENSDIGWVRISDVTKSGMYLRETTQRLSQLGVKHSRPVARGSLIMSICATVGRPIVTEIDVCIHDGFVVFDDLQADKLFIYYMLKWIEPDWSKHGQTGSQMNLNTGLITGTEISLPPLPEQAAIAAVLRDMDAELAAMEQRLAKTRALKQGMMQELLTGRTRLV
ncbi:MAG TPA: restriction endonuclease subunit S [Pseudomonas sp.]|uniref:restriction endonuclease subunit S n=1 Tax=Pseudomonas sp. SST3 TaxID=2267882 RepID=UPI000DFD4905|nr:restriction endonuclease subunit S [Pseudomonas sp. SST3]NKQ11061.1 restriction endonuclease subunit S [Pseudomonas sp. SST3]HAQ87449.1 restriction endonuclease subunit S [Pseudomonas sp.]HAW24542.1 restriction endonuclease subunit S [Pseudomonas sp.]